MWTTTTGVQLGSGEGVHVGAGDQVGAIVCVGVVVGVQAVTTANAQVAAMAVTVKILPIECELRAIMVLTGDGWWQELVYSGSESIARVVSDRASQYCLRWAGLATGIRSDGVPQTVSRSLGR